MTPSIYSLFVLGALLTCILTPLVRYLAVQKGFVDCLKELVKVHHQATPRLGGASVLISFLFVVTIAVLTVPQLRELLIGVSCDWRPSLLVQLEFLLLDFLDDLARLAPRTKLVGEFLIAGLVVWEQIYPSRPSSF